jgi:tetratricopeptide (TPR) repeat protein
MASTKPKELGERIRELRLDKGMTLASLAGDAMTEAYVSLIESGQRTPSDKALGHLAKQLSVDPEELRTGKPAGLDMYLQLDLQTVRRDIDRDAIAEAKTLLDKVARESKTSGLNRLAAKVEELKGLMAEKLKGPSAALPHYEKAEELWRDEPLHLRFGAVIGLSRCTDQRGDPQMAIHILDSYRRELEASGKPDPLALMQTYAAMIYPCFSAGLPQKAAEAARSALALEGRVDEPEDIACMHLSVARTLTNEGEYSDALSSLSKAEEIYLAGGWRNQVAKVQIAEAIVLATKEDFEAARDKLLEAAALLEESPNRLDEALAFNELGYVCRKLDDVHGALAYLEKARPLLEDTDIVEKAFNERELGLCLGNDKAAENHLKKAIDLYRISGNTTELASTFKELGTLYRKLGKIDLALEAMTEGLAAVEERGN